MKNDSGTKSHGRLQDSRLFWAILSLFAAMLIWLYYTTNYGVTEKKTFYGVEVTFTGRDAMRDTLNLVVSDQDVSTVNVTLSGTRRDLAQLTSSDIRAVVNLSNITMAGYRTMSYTLSYPSSVNQANIREESRSPSTVGLQVSKLSTKSFPVSGAFEGTVAEGYMVETSEMTFDPASVTFTGPEEELEQIAKVQVTVARDEVNAAFTAVGNYVLLDSQGEPLEFEDVQADVDTLSVNVPVSTIKEVALVVNVVDGGGATSDNVIVDVQPKTITIAGDAATLDGLNSIAVTTVRLSDALTFPALQYPIVLPNGVECLSGETSATVSLELTGVKSDLFIVTNLSAANVPEGFDYEIMESSKVVTVRAPENVLPRITANNVRVVADLTDVPAVPGRYRVPTTVYVDGFESAGAVGSYSMYVQMTEAEE